MLLGNSFHCIHRHAIPVGDCTTLTGRGGTSEFTTEKGNFLLPFSCLCSFSNLCHPSHAFVDYRQHDDRLEEEDIPDMEKARQEAKKKKREAMSSEGRWQHDKFATMDDEEPVVSDCL